MAIFSPNPIHSYCERTKKQANSHIINVSPWGERCALADFQMH